MSTRRHALALVLSLSMLVLSASTAAAQLPQQLVSLYRPAVEKLRSAYTNLSAEGTISAALPQQEKSREQQFAFRAGGQKRRLDLKTLSQKGMGLKVGTTEMRMATPYGSLVTVMRPDSDFFDDAKETSYGNTVSKIDAGCLLNYPYSLGSEGTILDMLLSPSVKITRVKQIEDGGRKLVRIDYQQQATYAGRSGIWTASLVLSPSESWALCGFTRTLGQGSGQVLQQAKLVYSGFEEDVPLVRSIETETVAGGRTTKREAISVTEIKLGTPDDYYFTAFAY